MKKIALIITYYGKWPKWFDIHLFSCGANPEVNWFFFSDIEPPANIPENVKFVHTTKQEIEGRFKEKLHTTINLDDSRKLCDLKVAYGYLFQEYIKDFDFWGFCDTDIVWGDIRKFITDDMLNKYEIISSRKNCISGHFTLFANNERINSIFKIFVEDDKYRERFMLPRYQWFDEIVLSEVIVERVKQNKLKVYWEQYLVNKEGEGETDSHQDYHVDKWLFENGRLYDLGKNRKEKTEHMYLHFINWKRLIQTIDFDPRADTRFYVSYNGISRHRKPEYVRWLTDIRNVFGGYYVKEKMRIRRKKWDKLLFKLKRKFGLTK